MIRRSNMHLTRPPPPFPFYLPAARYLCPLRRKCDNFELRDHIFCTDVGFAATAEVEECAAIAAVKVFLEGERAEGGKHSEPVKGKRVDGVVRAGALGLDRDELRKGKFAVCLKRIYVY